ncbi:PRP38 family-domain-containing protein [Polychytrium aggregatum]|uniref:PRP38 family-domain-containing protein n=1 Tax=Polychytrium aggregatum TaxID=110093 RepID=UPI0022FE8A5A|nr:PRP38 family-domain-containing protein [Polychytrium aggregatum]KAI9208640.1 PRP38 family-domain-containing protein [Polychytrium aggregatum]
MANRTATHAVALHGTNPQFLIEKIIRTRILDTLYWKEQCFGLSAETLVDKAVALKYIGGQHGNQRPTEFLCLTLKLLQLQPEKEIIQLFIEDEEFKYLRALGAFYLRLTGTSVEIYKSLEPLLLDKRKLRRRGMKGYDLTFIDEFVDELLTAERVCDTILPRITKRHVLEELGELEPRVSPLESELGQDLLDSDRESPDPAPAEHSAQEHGSDDDGGRRGPDGGHDKRLPDDQSPKSSDYKDRRDSARGRDRSTSADRRRDRRRNESRDRHRSPSRDGSRDRYRDRGYDRDRNRDRDRDRYRRRNDSRDRNRSRIHSRNDSRERRRDRSRDREQSPERYRSRNQGRAHSAERRDSSRDRTRDRERDNRSKRSPSRSTSPGRSRSREDARAHTREDGEVDEALLGSSAGKKSKNWSSKKVSGLFKKKSGDDEKSRSAKPAGASAGGSEGTFRESMSIEETNKMRLSLGLKPLQA